jgi:hypothetical protein
MSSSRSLTKSQARSLLSIARLKIARSRTDRAISRRTRIDHTCLGSRGFFWPTSNPLFQGRWHRSTGVWAYGILRHPAPRVALRDRMTLVPTDQSGFPDEHAQDRPLLAQSCRSRASSTTTFRPESSVSVLEVLTDENMMNARRKRPLLNRHRRSERVGRVTP